MQPATQNPDHTIPALSSGPWHYELEKLLAVVDSQEQGLLTLAFCLSCTTDKPSRSWIGDWWEGWVSLVLLGVLHLTHQDSLSPNQIHSDSSRFVQIHSFEPKFNQSYPDPPNLNQICSDSHRFLQPHIDLLIYMKFHTDSLRFTEFHTVSFRFT